MKMVKFMELIYSEIYGLNLENNGYCIPTLEFYYTEEERNLLPKSKYIIEEKESDTNLYTAYIPFFDTFFDGLKETTISKLNSILEFANKSNSVDYISREIWLPFLYTSNIEINNIKKNYNTHLLPIQNDKEKRPLYKKYNAKSKEQKEVEHYYRSKVAVYNNDIANMQYKIYINLTKHFSNNIKPTLKEKYISKKAREKDLPILSIMKQGVYGGVMNIDYKFKFHNELELLYSFLDSIFSSDYNYKIKKCKQCHNFYITLNTNSKHCHYCLPTIKKLQKQNYENKELIKIERRINQLFYAPNRLNEKEKYLKKKQQKKKDLLNGKITETEYVNWLLSHYRNKNN